jgi:hypothetical protein
MRKQMTAMKTPEAILIFCRLGLVPPAKILFHNIVITGLVSGMCVSEHGPEQFPGALFQSRILTAKFCL